MANTNAPFGLKAVDNLRQPGTVGRVRRYIVSSSNPLGIGDVVKSGGTADAVTGIATIDRAAAGDPIRGVVIGFDQVDGVSDANFNLIRTHCPASVGLFAMVCDDPDTIYEVQTDASLTFAVTMVGENADVITAVDCNTVTGLSKTALSTTDHKTATAQLRILEVPRLGIDNEVGDYAIVRVLINEHELKSTTGL